MTNLHPTSRKLERRAVQIVMSLGQVDRARAIHTESLSLCRDLGSQRGIAMCLEKLAGMAEFPGVCFYLHLVQFYIVPELPSAIFHFFYFDIKL